MDVVLLSGCALIGTMLAAMAGLIHAEVRYTRRALHCRPPRQPYARGYTRPGGMGHSGYSAHAQRPYTHANAGCQPPKQPAQPSLPVKPWAPFEVGPGVGRDDLKRQYRALARAHHPDRGGDPLVMARINLLYAELVDS